MKLLRRTLIATAALVALGAQAAATVGQPAPDFTLKDTNGKTVRLSDFKGKHVVLEWTNPGCPLEPVSSLLGVRIGVQSG